MILLLAGALSAPLTAQAQSRGGGHSAAGGASRGAVVSRAPVAAMRVGPVRTAPVYVVRRPAVLPAIVPYYSPYYSTYSPNYYGAPYGAAYPTVPAYASVQPAPQPSDYAANYTGSDISDLSNQIQQLTAEVEQLRNNQTQRDSDAASTTPGPSADTIPTVLIFRDGHRLEIYNYAVSGQTLWVLTGRSSTRIPLSDLDLDATQTANQGNGVRILLPH